jgi:hypothetical protein
VESFLKFIPHCNIRKELAEVVSLFGMVQVVYTVMSGSTCRRNLMIDTLKSQFESEKAILVNSFCDTKCSARYDAMKALKANYFGMIDTLNMLYEDDDKNSDTAR